MNRGLRSAFVTISALIMAQAFNGAPASAQEPTSARPPTVPTSQGSLTYAQLSGGALGLLDLRSGAFTQFGNTSVQLVGVGMLAGWLYSDTTSGTLYRLGPRTGKLTKVGSAGIGFQEFGSTTSGLFAIDNGMTLYSIDPTTGTARPIGPTGLTLPDHNGLSSGSSTLYYIQQFGTSTPTVYTLDASTGAATPIGTTPGVFGPVVIKGKLYAESWVRCMTNPSGICAHSIDAFDPTTGNTVTVSSVRTPLQAASDGLAPVPLLSIPTRGTVTGLFLQSRAKDWIGPYYNQRNQRQPSLATPYHSGVDIAGGTTGVDCSTTHISTKPVYAAGDGTVIRKEFHDGYGWNVVIDHHQAAAMNGGYLFTLYAHMGTRGHDVATSRSCILHSLKVGDIVSTGTLLGYQGDSGNATGIHLHWQLFLNPDADVFNPKDLKQLGTPNPANSYPVKGAIPLASPDFYTCMQLTANDASRLLNKTVERGRNSCPVP